MSNFEEIKIKEEQKEKRKEKITWYAICGIFGVFVVAMVVYLCYSFITDLKKLNKELIRIESEVDTDTVYLASVNYDSMISGRFCLGSGRISDKQYYVAYEILEDGGKKLFKMDADETIIYDVLEVNDTAYVEIDKNGNGFIKAIRLYVPEGTIVQDYDLSLD